MKKLLLLALFVFSAQLSPAQSKSGNSKTKAPAKTTTRKPAAKPAATKQTAPAAKPATQAAATPAAPKPAEKAPAKLRWQTPQMQEAMNYYTSLQFQEAQAKFREAAAQGEADALYFLGRMHQYRQLKYDSVQIDTLAELQNRTKYFSADSDSARYYYELALQENSPLGHLGMAELMILRTEEDKQNFLQKMREAAVVIRTKAVEGDPFSNRMLGSMYYTGYGEMKDLGYAFNYLNRAANKGDVVAYTYLANLYLDGEGVEPNKEKALFWLKKGAEAGDREALYTLGLLYEEGTVGTPNLEEARKLYRQAISKGSVSAYEQLRYMNQTADQKLVIASITRNPDMMERALNNKANVNTTAIPDDYEAEELHGRTPLMNTLYIPLLLEDYGVIYQPEVRPVMAGMLLRKGAEVNAQDADGRTALHHTVAGARISNSQLFEQEQVQLLDTLIKYKADLNVKDKKGNTALTAALESTSGQHLGIMELEKLLTSGANPNIQNNEGKTPLILACELNSNFEIILALIQAGADPKLRDQSGKAAIDYTTHENVQNILMAAGSPAKKQ
ncbi:SEL1-like repeat protein [Pontibacter sp. Tf4]|uniref:ankyrin repeat domain-containing protein n=1 Tax=Pontibacter sp. Tf4 TaxID=2761620 RepID=UPI0016248DA3|nr:ankyrin repeat domain-containing protein [Pontibacter sp. Tf4]MBB6612011.1 SEL1-like repeat protein [Pontibacter sp. Tf4]